MITCVCLGISDRVIMAAIESGSDTVQKVQEKTGIGMCCGICLYRLDRDIEEIKKKIKEKNTGS